MSLEVIDAPLRARGIEINGVAGPGESMQLGPYGVTEVRRERLARGEALLAAALPRPASFHQLRFELQAPQARLAGTLQGAAPAGAQPGPGGRAR